MTSTDDLCPVVMRGVMTSADWPALAWSPGDWAEAVTEARIRVRRGQRQPSLDTPQWERDTQVRTCACQCLIFIAIRVERFSSSEQRTISTQLGGRRI